jgi:hypothetical protein
LTVHHYGVVTSGALPTANGVGVAGLEILGMDAVGGKVAVALHYLTLIALSEDDPIPDCFSHSLGRVK